MPESGKVAIFSPHPMLSTTIEAMTAEAAATSTYTPPARASG
jgi:hypothetical protein